MKERVVTVGNFDGVHLGHRQIFTEVLRLSREMKFHSLAVTFHPHPAVVLGYPAPKLLLPPSQRCERITQLGIEECKILPFTDELSQRSAEEFVRQNLMDRLRMKVLVMGPDNHIGRNREGTPAILNEMAGRLGFKFFEASRISFQGGEVSSCKIRELLSSGKVEEAAKFLGRHHENEGSVIRGDGRGHKIGFPTANLDIPEVFQLPGRGVYAVYVTLDGQVMKGVANVGVRPTFTSDEREVVEAHLLEFSGELFGKMLKVLWIGRIRDEKKFDSSVDLTAQINRDVETAKKLLQSETIVAGNYAS